MLLCLSKCCVVLNYAPAIYFGTIRPLRRQSLILLAINVALILTCITRLPHFHIISPKRCRTFSLQNNV